MVWALGGELLAPHFDVEQVKNVFGEQHQIDQLALLGQMARVGTPVDVAPGGKVISSGNWHKGTVAAPDDTWSRCRRTQWETSRREERS